MEHVNPYEPPTPASTTKEDAAAGDSGALTARVLFTSEHLIETLTRYRSQHLGRRIWKWFRYAAALVFLIVAVIGFFIPQYGASVFMLALAIFMFFPHKIDDFLAQRNFRKSPHYNTQQMILLSDGGLYSKSEVQESTLKWTAFSRAVIFRDGVLMFQGPKTVHWLPDRAFERERDALDLRKLVESKLPTNQAIVTERRWSPLTNR